MENYHKRLLRYREAMNRKPTIKELSLRKFLKFNGLKFKTQYLISPYIVDVFIPDKSLVIELDGDVHNNSRQKEWDYKREDYLMSIGLIVQRFENHIENEEILKTINLYQTISLDKKMIIYKRIACLATLASTTDVFKNKFNDARDILKDIKKFNKLSF